MTGRLTEDVRMGDLAGFSHVVLTVRDIRRSRVFYGQTLGLQLLDSSETYCAFLIGSLEISALILTSHEQTADVPFSELRPGLDHVSLAVPDLEALNRWHAKLESAGVESDLRRSEWGHHLNFRDPDNIAIEFVVLEPDAEVRSVLDKADLP
jgi:catechol 2,3-dioxygenase-like lactoylglutathione lyase family enzyme